MGYIIMEKQNQLYYKACLCSYCGDNYNGWQRQKNAIGIQNILENTLSSLYNHEILIAGSGRTDTNVHALGQVFHFSSSKYVDNKTLLKGLNGLLPDDIVIYDIIDVNSLFHAGKSIISKTYEYKILNTPVRDPFLLNRALWVRKEINIENLKNILKEFEGTHDFHSFCVKKTKKENTVRTINYINIEKNNNNISILINANGFLHNMVRIIIGTSLKMEKDNIHYSHIANIFNSKDRRCAGPTAHAYALYQKEAIYNNENIAGLMGIPEKYRV